MAAMLPPPKRGTVLPPSGVAGLASRATHPRGDEPISLSQPAAPPLPTALDRIDLFEMSVVDSNDQRYPLVPEELPQLVEFCKKVVTRTLWNALYRQVDESVRGGAGDEDVREVLPPTPPRGVQEGSKYEGS